MAQPTGWGALLRVLDTILPSAAGALVSLRFLPGTPVQRVASLLLGVVCAHYLGNGVIGLWQVPAGLVSDAVKFIAGVFGLTIVGYAYGELPALRRLAHDWLQQAAQRWTGGRKE